MAETTAPQGAPAKGSEGATRRDLLTLTGATTAFVAVGVGAVTWPFIASMNPAQDVLALASIDVDLRPIAAGQAITALWRGKPVFVRNRTAEEIRAARAVPLTDLPDPQTDQTRVQREQWLVLVGVCTHLGCVPIGQRPTDQRGDYGGWFCPCHGSHYDTSGRIRKGPAPRNLLVPTYSFLSDTQIRIG